MKHLALVPLIGGMAIGAENAIGAPPEAILSYSAFELNDSYYTKYLTKRGLDIKRYDIEHDTIPSFGEIDVVTSVCPCSGLSAANRNSGAGCQANKWMYESTDYALSTIKPKVLIGENAPGLFGNKGAEVAQNLRNIALKYGYSLQLVKTSTHYHGLPQRRIRCFFILWRDHGPVKFEQHEKQYEGTWVDFLDTFEEHGGLTSSKANSPWFDAAEAIAGLNPADLASKLTQIGQSIFFFLWINHNEGYRAWAEEHRELKGGIGTVARRYFTAEKKLTAFPNSSLYDSSPFFRADPYYSSVMFRTRSQRLHTREHRQITDREAMRLMGLPENMDLPLAKDTNVIAQNVPTCTAEWIVRSCIEMLNPLEIDLVVEMNKDQIHRWSNLNNNTYMPLDNKVNLPQTNNVSPELQPS